MSDTEESNTAIPNLNLYEAVPDNGIASALALMNSGALYRYCSVDPQCSEVALLEKEFAAYVGSRFALATNSCGSAMYIAMLCVGVRSGDRVLSSGFTYTAVPSAIVNLAAIPVLVECDENFCIDIADLERKITPDVRCLLLSHMRGHVCDMDRISALCRAHDLALIEDCAHSLGGRYAGTHTGRFGMAGCFSTQSHKLLNSGEGGLLVTDDDELIAKAVLYSGSQETFWKRHFAQSPYFARYQNSVPNLSARMSNLSAALIRAQLAELDDRIGAYQERYAMLATILAASPYIRLPKPLPEVSRAPDTLQFHLLFDEDGVQRFVNLLTKKDIPVKIFGAPDNPRFFKSWQYIDGIEDVNLPTTARILRAAGDLRLPGYLTDSDVRVIGETMCAIADEVGSARPLLPNRDTVNSDRG